MRKQYKRDILYIVYYSAMTETRSQHVHAEGPMHFVHGIAVAIPRLPL